MHKIVNPQQTRLFDPFDSVLTEKTRKRLLDSRPGGNVRPGLQKNRKIC